MVHIETLCGGDSTGFIPVVKVVGKKGLSCLSPNGCLYRVNPVGG